MPVRGRDAALLRTLADERALDARAVRRAGSTERRLLADWLAPEPRLRASLVVPSQFPDLAVAEIERCGAQDGFVQVLLPAHSPAPYGNRRYWPLYAAAVEHDLVVGIHFGGAPGSPPTASGWPSYDVDDYVNMATLFQSQVLSLIAEGVFAQFPTLRVSLVEGGFTWLPALLWRMDKEWKGLRREVPWLKQLPSDEVCAPRTISNRRMTFAGLKKCIPSTSSGRAVSFAIASTSRVEVLVARIAPGFAIRSRSAKMRFLRSISSNTASMMKSASLRASNRRSTSFERCSSSLGVGGWK